MLQEAIIAFRLGLGTCTASIYAVNRMQFISGIDAETYGFSPFGFNGFCFGSVGSKGFPSGAGFGDEPPHQDDIYVMGEYYTSLRD